MGRRERARLWVAVPSAIAVNGLLLAGLILLEPPPPVIEDSPIVSVELEVRQRRRTPPRRSSAPRATSPSMASRTSPASAPSVVAGPPGLPASDPAASGPAGATTIEPAWRVDPRAVERWRITEGNPDFGWGRYYRACKGLSSEHMTDEEKDRCYGGWGAARPRSPR